MAVKIDTAEIFRDGSFLDTSQSWTVSGWFYQGSTTPDSGGFRTYFEIFNEPFGLGEYIALISDTETDDVILQVFDGITSATTVPYTPTPETWFYAAIEYDEATTTLSLRVDGALVDSVVFDLSTIDFSDASQHVIGPWGDEAISYIRVWQQALSGIDLLTESGSETAVRELDLLSDTKLTGVSDLRDYFSVEDWALVDGTLSFIEGPFLTPIPPEELPEVTGWALSRFDLKNRREERS